MVSYRSSEVLVYLSIGRMGLYVAQKRRTTAVLATDLIQDAKKGGRDGP